MKKKLLSLMVVMSLVVSMSMTSELQVVEVRVPIQTRKY